MSWSTATRIQATAKIRPHAPGGHPRAPLLGEQFPLEQRPPDRGVGAVGQPAGAHGLLVLPHPLTAAEPSALQPHAEVAPEEPTEEAGHGLDPVGGSSPTSLSSHTFSR